MINFIRKMFGSSEKPDFRELLEQGAVILDVRTRSEFKQACIKSSLNIPLDELSANLSKLRSKDTAIITCCASGIRSASARNILRRNGFGKVYNGGGWYSLQKKLG